MNKQSYLAITIATLFLQACGGSSSDSTSATTPPSAPTPSDPVLNLSVSDAPVDDVMQVVACFSEIELKASDEANNQTFLIGDTQGSVEANDLCTDSEGAVLANTRGVDLLTLAGMASTELLSGIEIGAGEYTQVRLAMSDASYAIVDLDQNGVADDADADGNPDKLPVTVPSSELKLDGFTANLGQQTDLTVEFDLRKGMTDPVGQPGYILKPRGVRLVDNSVSGHIQGTVAETLLINNECSVAPENLDEVVASVYLYEGTTLDATTLADNGGTEGLEALTSVAVLFDGVDTYSFEIGFVNAAGYTLALTCDEDADPEGDDEVGFISVIEAEVAAEGQVSEVSFSE
jgi:hypothetical protein